MLFVAGMWFQDLFNYDFRRTEMCIIPYGTQMGEISFCAYNTGAGWRNILEKMKANATVAEWYSRAAATPSTRRTGICRSPTSTTRSRCTSTIWPGARRTEGRRPPRKMTHLPIVG